MTGSSQRSGSGGLHRLAPFIGIELKSQAALTSGTRRLSGWHTTARLLLVYVRQVLVRGVGGCVFSTAYIDIGLDTKFALASGTGASRAETAGRLLLV